MQDCGALSRRLFIGQVAWVTAASRVVSAAGFRNPTVHHVSLQVSDLARSSEFYHRAFGCVVQNRADGTVLLSLGNGYIVLRRGSPAGRVDHFAIGIDGFEKRSVALDLKSRGADPAEDSTAVLSVKDPDGVPVQVVSNATYAGAPTAFPGSSLDHVSVCASNLQRTTDFYRRVFDCAVSKPALTFHLSVGKGHISLQEGESPGKVDHFAIGLRPFDEASVVRDLKARGAVPMRSTAQGLHVIDPDGYPVQLLAGAV